MSSNDQIILDQILEQQRAERAPHLTANKYFELFVAEQLLKHYDLSYDEIESGMAAGVRRHAPEGKFRGVEPFEAA